MRDLSPEQQKFIDQQKRIVAELCVFFSSIKELPKPPIQLTVCEKIVDVKLFLSGNFATCDLNLKNGKTCNQEIIRLIKFKQILQKTTK